MKISEYEAQALLIDKPHGPLFNWSHMIKLWGRTSNPFLFVVS